MVTEGVGMSVGRSSLSFNPELPNWYQLPTSEDSPAISPVFCSLFLFKVAPRINEIQVITE